MTHAIIYSPANLDSCLASTIVQSNCAKQGLTVEVFAYNRGSEFNAPTGFDNVSILGADLSSEALLGLFEANTDTAVFHNYIYENTTIHATKLLLEINSQGRYKEHHYKAADNFRISVSSRILSENVDIEDDSIVYDKGKSSTDSSLVKDYSGVVHKFMNFYSLTAAETLFLFANMSNVRKAATGMETLDLYKPTESGYEARLYDEYVQDVRLIVKSNMSLAYYPGANGSAMLTPTICVGEKDCMLAMRFINYAHNDVISYEDTKSARIYRILSVNNLQWYIKRFEPRDIWTEGHLTYIKTELLQHVR